MFEYPKPIHSYHVIRVFSSKFIHAARGINLKLVHDTKVFAFCISANHPFVTPILSVKY